MSNQPIHKHRDIANHSPGQQRMFFALGSKLEHDPEELKENAKKHFSVICFNDLTKSNMMYLIDRLVKQEKVRQLTPPKTKEIRKDQSIEDRQKEAEEANRKMLDSL